MSTNIYSPGSECPISGKYAVVWIETRAKTGEQLSVSHGEKFPITSSDAQGYVLIFVSDLGLFPGHFQAPTAS